MSATGCRRPSRHGLATGAPGADLAEGLRPDNAAVGASAGQWQGWIINHSAYFHSTFKMTAAGRAAGRCRASRCSLLPGTLLPRRRIRKSGDVIKLRAIRRAPAVSILAARVRARRRGRPCGGRPYSDGSARPALSLPLLQRCDLQVLHVGVPPSEIRGCSGVLDASRLFVSSA
jgi:hypothetical protein